MSWSLSNHTPYHISWLPNGKDPSKSQPYRTPVKSATGETGKPAWPLLNSSKGMFSPPLLNARTTNQPLNTSTLQLPHHKYYQEEGPRKPLPTATRPLQYRRGQRYSRSPTARHQHHRDNPPPLPPRGQLYSRPQQVRCRHHQEDKQPIQPSCPFQKKRDRNRTSLAGKQQYRSHSHQHLAARQQQTASRSRQRRRIIPRETNSSAQRPK